MNAVVSIGGAAAYILEHAILVYESEGGGAYATLHDVYFPPGSPNEAAPRLGVGRPVDTAFLRRLGDALGSRVPAEVLPVNVVCRTAELIAWWTPAQMRPLFWKPGTPLAAVSGRHFPTPALVWLMDQGRLFLRAIAQSERPAAETALYVAPFWNTYPASGLVCQGDMRRPEHMGAETLKGWEDAYFGSLFTNTVRGSFTRRKGGLEKLWPRLASDRGEVKEFPASALLPAKLTLREFIDGGGRGNA